MTIGIFYNHSNNGPGKVINNLIQGLYNIGIEINHNSIGNVNGSLNQIRFDLPHDTFMGPNLVVLPSHNPQLFSKYKNIIVPSEWVRNCYYSFTECKESKIIVWSVGIDTNKFEIKKDIKQDCFVYVKNRSDQELNNVINFLKSKRLSYSILRYGQYTESQLIQSCIESKFCILLTYTESQGIAYMEILSTNTPCYVFNMKIWEGFCPATSTPYFDESLCGIIDNDFDFNKLENFFNNYQRYNPREYILKNHTLEISAIKYSNILTGVL